MKISHYFSVAFFVFLISSISIAMAMQDGPEAQVMQDKSDVTTQHEVGTLILQGHYDWNKLSIEELKELSVKLLDETSLAQKQLRNCCCVKGICCPCISKLKKLEKELQEKGESLNALINEKEFSEQKQLMVQHICALAYTNHAINEFREKICYRSYICCMTPCCCVVTGLCTAMLYMFSQIRIFH